MQIIPEETKLELELSRQIHAACIWESTARKIGNVHPLGSFPNLHFTDFLLSAGAIAPILCKTRKLGLGNPIATCIVWRGGDRRKLLSQSHRIL